MREADEQCVPDAQVFESSRVGSLSVREEHDRSNHGQEDSEEPWLTKGLLHGLGKSQPDCSGWNRTERDKHHEARRCRPVRRRQSARGEVTDHRARHSVPIACEIGEKRGECPDVEPNIERETLILPTEKRWDQDQMS